MDEQTRQAIALKRFSIISPVLNGQVKNQTEYFEEISSQPISMPHYGDKLYSPRTLATWYTSYLHDGIDALKPSGRKDAGSSRKISHDIDSVITQKFSERPRMTRRMLYQELVTDNVISPKDVSIQTFYRYLAKNSYLLDSTTSDECKELRRFSYQFINELWQTDIMYGPNIPCGNRRPRTYLIAYMDDASRLITGASFHFEQNFSVLRATLKQAVLTRGIPKLLYSDNGSIYKCAQLSYICASIGTTLLHAKPYTPTSKGKIERFFHTVRSCFLNSIDISLIKSIDELNSKFNKWLNEEYQRKVHSGTNMAPLDFFMKQSEHIKMFSNPDSIDEHFLIRANRKIAHDATLKLESVLYETDPILSKKHVEVRYDPEWLNDSSMPILIFEHGKQIGTARQVNFNDNSYVKRKDPHSPLVVREETNADPSFKETIGIDEEVHISQQHSVSVSFTQMLNSNEPNSERRIF